MSGSAAAPAIDAGRMSVPEPAAAAPADAAAADGIAELSQFISFAIGDDQYGVDIMAVREIKGWSQITQLPRQPDYMRGVLNLRGIMVPIIDLRCRFGQGMTEATPLHIVIVVQIDARHVGLLADRVLDIVGINATKIQPVPRIAQGSRADFLSGLVTIESGMIALIDLSRILSVSSGGGGEIKAGGQQGAAQPQGDDHDREQARAEAVN
jgi:purine-binding chemotaxis protein CheW